MFLGKKNDSKCIRVDVRTGTHSDQSVFKICALINLNSKLFVLSFFKGFLEEHICPLLIQLTDFSNLDDYRMEAVGVSQLTFNKF